MDRNIIKSFWNCGDDQIIEFALLRAHLNRLEKEAIILLLDECMTQESAAEKMGVSPRRFQEYWYSAADKMLKIPWVVAYGKELQNKD